MIIKDVKAKGLYGQILDAAREYAQIRREEREEICYLVSKKQQEILSGVLELENLEQK